MSTPARHRSTAERLGNAIAILLLASLGFSFIYITEGDWWVAAPRAQRWWLSAIVIATYTGFCIWTSRGGRG